MITKYTNKKVTKLIENECLNCVWLSSLNNEAYCDLEENYCCKTVSKCKEIKAESEALDAINS